MGAGQVGTFSVKSAYHLAFDEIHRAVVVSSSSSPSNARSCWKFIWSCGVPPSVANFAWRVATDRLPTWKNKHKIGLEHHGTGPVCGMEEEDNFHPFIRCRLPASPISVVLFHGRVRAPVYAYVPAPTCGRATAATRAQPCRYSPGPTCTRRRAPLLYCCCRLKPIARCSADALITALLMMLPATTGTCSAPSAVLLLMRRCRPHPTSYPPACTPAAPRTRVHTHTHMSRRPPLVAPALAWAVADWP